MKLPDKQEVLNFLSGGGLHQYLIFSKEDALRLLESSPFGMKAGSPPLGEFAGDEWGLLEQTDEEVVKVFTAVVAETAQMKARFPNLSTDGIQIDPKSPALLSAVGIAAISEEGRKYIQLDGSDKVHKADQVWWISDVVDATRFESQLQLTYRHELGHILADDRAVQIWKEIKKEQGISDLWVRQKLGAYATTDTEEELAEGFSLYTSAHYSKLSSEMSRLILGRSFTSWSVWAKEKYSHPIKFEIELLCRGSMRSQSRWKRFFEDPGYKVEIATKREVKRLQKLLKVGVEVTHSAHYLPRPLELVLQGMIDRKQSPRKSSSEYNRRSSMLIPPPPGKKWVLRPGAELKPGMEIDVVSMLVDADDDRYQPLVPELDVDQPGSDD